MDALEPGDSTPERLDLIKAFTVSQREAELISQSLDLLADLERQAAKDFALRRAEKRIDTHVVAFDVERYKRTQYAAIDASIALINNFKKEGRVLMDLENEENALLQSPARGAGVETLQAVKQLLSEAEVNREIAPTVKAILTKAISAPTDFERYQSREALRGQITRDRQLNKAYHQMMDCQIGDVDPLLLDDGLVDDLQDLMVKPYSEDWLDGVSQGIPADQYNEKLAQAEQRLQAHRAKRTEEYREYFAGLSYEKQCSIIDAMHPD